MLVRGDDQVQRQRTVQFVVEHRKDRVTVNLDANAALGWIDAVQLSKEKNGGAFTAEVTGVGYVIDSSRSTEFPTLCFRAGW
jgi:hypothetical protein